MTALSKNGVAVVLFILGYFGFDVSEDVLVEFISAVFTIVSFALLIINQLQRTDTKWFIFKK